MFTKILIANRGEIACRIIRTCQRLGIQTVAVYSDVDADLPFVNMADEAYPIGPAPSRESYLRGDTLIKIALKCGAQAIHPAYGFLSENAEFARAVEAADLIFIGPSPDVIQLMGDKIDAKALAHKAGVNLIPGTTFALTKYEEALDFATTHGYPILLKAAAGGGGKGMRVASCPDEVASAFDRAASEALSSFGDGRLFVEKYIENPRHIEIQILGDKFGNVIHLGERDCSLQRRHQKIIEEAPSPFLDALSHHPTNEPSLRQQMIDQALKLTRLSNYYSAGTVEFIVSPEGEFYFLEMNTRLQVEHPVTEAIFRLDLVEWMILIANGEKLPPQAEGFMPKGHAIEARLYAEDPNQDFLPSAGRLVQLYFPPVKTDETNTNGIQSRFNKMSPDQNILEMFGDIPDFLENTSLGNSYSKSSIIRLDSGYEEGDTIGIYYDPMVAKIISWGGTRQEALEHLTRYLSSMFIEGPTTNQDFLIRLLTHPAVQKGNYHTHTIQNELSNLINSPRQSGQDGNSDSSGEDTKHLHLSDIPISLRPFFIVSASYIEFNTENQGTRDFLCISGSQSDAQTFGVHFLNDKYGHPQFLTDGTWGGMSWQQQTQEIHFRWLYQRQVFELTLDGISYVGRHQKHPFSGHRITLEGYGVLLNVIRPDVWRLLQKMPQKKNRKDVKSIKAPMPGVLIQLPIITGQQVTKGQPLALIEAMKMENILKSPIKGIISEICVKVGDSLARGQVIAKFE